MWTAMLECHNAQYITVSLAYHMKNSTTPQQSESYRHAITNLQNEIECFTSSFVNWIDAQKSYVEALNAWLQKCVLPPEERSWRRRVPFSPRRALAPPIFVLFGDWLTGINSLPSKEVTDSLKGLVSNLHDLFEQQKEEKQGGRKPEQMGINGELEQEGNTEEKCESNSNFVTLQASLTGLFDQMTKFSEALVKVYENVKQGTEQASAAYINGGRFRFQPGLDTLCL